MRSRCLLIALLLYLAAASIASAQETIQLPQFHYSTVNTTVLVPDQGEVLLGGFNSAQDGRKEFGVPMLSKFPVLGRPFTNSAIGQTRGASRFSVKAQIHDFEAMDQALLAEAARRRGEAPDVNLVDGRRQSPPQIVNAPPLPELSFVELNRRQRAEADSRRDDIAATLERAQAAEAAGKPRVALIYYRIVLHDTRDPELKSLAKSRLDALSGRTPAVLAASDPPGAAR